MKWKTPPEIKIWEALAAVADRRINLSNEGGKVMSSDRSKEYTVLWDEERREVMTNDNGTYWQGYLGYPAIAFLIEKGEVTIDRERVRGLVGIEWKKLNTKYKNDYAKTLSDVGRMLANRGFETKEIEDIVKDVMGQLAELDLKPFGKKLRPPK